MSVSVAGFIVESVGTPEFVGTVAPEAGLSSIRSSSSDLGVVVVDPDPDGCVIVEPDPMFVPDSILVPEGEVLDGVEVELPDCAKIGAEISIATQIGISFFILNLRVIFNLTND